MTVQNKSTRPLHHILSSNAKSLEADLTQFAQLDESLTNIPVHLGHDDLSVNFENGKVTNTGFVFEGTITLPDHTKERLPLVNARTTGESIELEFLQDVGLDGKQKTYTYTPSESDKKEYNSLRNALFNELHNVIITEYSGENSAKLVRKRFKSDLD